MTSVLSIEDQASLSVLAERQAYRREYWDRNDPLLEERLSWRTAIFRHLVHLLPGQHVAVVGAPDIGVYQQCVEVTKGRNPITRVSFNGVNDDEQASADVDREILDGTAFLDRARSESWADCVLGFDLLDQRNCGHVLEAVFKTLKPGGRLVLFETNPWNPWLRLKRRVGLAGGDTRRLLTRTQLYELISEVGFIQVFSVFHDFVYGLLARRLFRRLVKISSVIMENMPLVQGFAGSIIVHARKPGNASATLPPLATQPSLLKAVSVVVPCHNEEMNVRPLVDAMRAYYNDYLHEIILVDDNSHDRTREVILQLAAHDSRIKPVLRTPPPGVGRALQEGYAAATGEWVLSMDCDFQHLLPEFEDLFDAAAAGADVVVGSRFSRMSLLLNYPWPKIVANRGFHLIMNLVLGIRFRDLTNNLKLMRRTVVAGLDVQSPGFSANAETGLIPVLQGFAVAEIPISWVNRTPGMGVSSFKLARVGGGYLWVLRSVWHRRRSLRSISTQSPQNSLPKPSES